MHAILVSVQAVTQNARAPNYIYTYKKKVIARVLTARTRRGMVWGSKEKVQEISGDTAHGQVREIELIIS